MELALKRREPQSQPEKKKLKLEEYVDTDNFTKEEVKKKVKTGGSQLVVKRSPLIVAKTQPTEAELRRWLSTVPGFIEGLTETDFKQTRLYNYQVKYLNRKAMFWHINKSRQSGYSYTFAAEGLAKAHLMDKYTKIFISINQEEANEKITYARALYDSMPLAWQKRLITDNKKCLEFEGTRNHRTTITRVISHAQREPRGKGGNTDVTLDEAAHYTYGDQIYVAAIPIITRGLGCITVGSTPLGKSGIHWEIANNPEYQRIYTYQKVYWWDCRDFVKKGKFKEAKRRAPEITTAERVNEYGNEKIKSIFISMDLESFQQEYECYHIDETVAFFPMSLINKCVFSNVTDNIFIEDDEYACDHKPLPIELKFPRVQFTYDENLDDVISKKHMGIIRGDVYVGFDVGRRRHSAELMIIEDVPGGPLSVRGRINFHNVDFETMEAELKRCITGLNVLRMRIDETGPGIQLAENMERNFPGVCEGITFTASWKEENVSHVRRLMEAGHLAIPDDRDIKNQIHSIKRVVTDTGKIRYDAERNKEHHGDILWGLALGVSELRQMEPSSITIDTCDGFVFPPNIIHRPVRRMFVSGPMMRVISPSTVQLSIDPDRNR